jgi:hypothetical protein
MLDVTPGSKIMSNEKSIGPDFSLRSGVEEVHIVMVGIELGRAIH